MSGLAVSVNRPLTPAQHRWIRTHVLLIPVYVWAVFSWTHFFGHLPRADGPVRDFMHFYVQGVVASTGETPALYDIDRHAQILEERVPSAKNVRYPPVYGPQVSVLFSPFGRLPYESALRLWLAITVLVTAVCMWALWRVSGRLRGQAWPVLVLVAASPALRFDLGSGQAAALGLACVTGGYLALRSGRPFLAGLAIGSLAYKPPLGLVMAFVFIAAREWRIVAGAAAAVLIQLGLGCLYWGVSILVPYVDALRALPSVAADMEVLKEQMHSWRSFFELLGLPPSAALAAYAAMALATASVALVCWRSRGPLSLRFAVLVLASLLVDPHLYGYDLLLALPALLLLLDWAASERDLRLLDLVPSLERTSVGRWSCRSVSYVLLALCYAAPILGDIAAATRVQPSVVSHSLVIGLAAARLRRESAPGLNPGDWEHDRHS